VFGLIDVSARGIELAHYDCETGKPWSPPPIVGRPLSGHPL